MCILGTYDILLQGHTSEEWDILISVTAKSSCIEQWYPLKTFNLENANAISAGKNMNDRGITRANAFIA